MGCTYRDVEELLAERGVDVDHVTVYRWVQRFTPEFVSAARPRRHVPGDRWFVDETYVKVAGWWTYLYWAIDQYGQVIDVWLSAQRDLAAARVFFSRALASGSAPVEVVTDRAPAYLRSSTSWSRRRSHHRPVREQRGRVRPRPPESQDPTDARPQAIPISSHARRRSCFLVQNLRRGHYDIATDLPARDRLAAAFNELILAL
jgi:transposase, IS6 family